MNKHLVSNDQDPLKLDNQLCFMLYTASRKMTSAYRPLLNELGLTYPQYLVMLVLWEYFIGEETNKQGLKVSVISNKLQLDNGTLTPLLKRLEAQGLVTRNRDSKDERVVRVGLTPSGTELRSIATKVPETMLCNSGLSADEFSEIYSELKTVLNKIPGMLC